jgi:hypothetical protein
MSKFRSASLLLLEVSNISFLYEISYLKMCMHKKVHYGSKYWTL